MKKYKTKINGRGFVAYTSPRPKKIKFSYILNWNFPSSAVVTSHKVYPPINNTAFQVCATCGHKLIFIGANTLNEEAAALKNARLMKSKSIAKSASAIGLLKKRRKRES